MSPGQEINEIYLLGHFELGVHKYAGLIEFYGPQESQFCKIFDLIDSQFCGK